MLQEYAVFLIPIVVGVIAQVTKFINFTLKHGWNPSYAFTHGHMPSAHTAFITALVVSVGHYEGMNSGAFSVAIILAIIVIDDALRLRVYMGDQGRYLNTIVRQLSIDTQKFPRLKERVGHKISEVFAGGLVGILLTLLLIWIIG